MNMDKKPGTLYSTAARSVYKVLGPSPEEERKSRKEKREKMEGAKEAFRQKKAEWEKAKKLYPKDNERRKELKKKYEKTKKEYEKKEKVFKQKDFYDAVNFVKMDITAEEAILFSTTATLLTLFTLLILTLVSYMQLSVLTFRIFLVSTIVVPLIVFFLLSNYPEILAERRKVKTLAKTPEAINYLSISMRLNPSLERAIHFTSENSNEPVASGFRKVLWNIYLNKYHSIEKSMISFARRWGEWNEDFKLAMYSIRQAALENTQERLNRSLDRANRIIREGTMSKVEQFAASLSTPTTVLFAFGILLPLVIGALLPMLSMGDLGFGGGQVGGGTMQTDTGPSKAPLIILLMNVIFPVAAFAYSFKILGDRPGTTSPPDIEPTLTIKQKKRLMLICAIIGIAIFSFGLYLLNYVGGDSYIMAIFTIPLLWGITAPISIYMYMISYKKKKKREEILELERQFPDALFQLGSQMVQGKSLENSLKSISESLEGSKAAALFEKIVTRMNIKGESLNKTLFGREGLLKEIPSRMVRVSLKAVARTSKKDPEHAGRTIIEISSYQKEMAKMENDIRNKLASTIDTMKATGALFAPIVMGITSSLYVLLSDILQEEEIGGATMLDSHVFTFIVGFYLIQILFVIIYFSVGIKDGGDRIEREYMIGTMLPVAVALFSVTLIFGQMMMGVR